MSYKRIKTIETATFVQGTVNCTYDTLCRYFGEPDIPQLSEHQKIQGEWLVYFNYGKLTVRINDWKQSKLFLGEELGKDLTDVAEWQVSSDDSTNQNALEFVRLVVSGQYPD
jgi:hypothetical protein